jgi:hypothetical protein
MSETCLKVHTYRAPLVGDALNFRLLSLELQSESKRSERDIHKRTIEKERERKRDGGRGFGVARFIQGAHSM